MGHPTNRPHIRQLRADVGHQIKYQFVMASEVEPPFASVVENQKVR
jgi:hypothetical protein